MELDTLDYNSEEEVHEKEHSRFVEAISKLDKTQHIKKPTRSEPTLRSSEFHLVKSGSNKDNVVLVTDLVKVLGKTAKHAEIGKKLRTTQKKTKTLQKPLEKPQAERIQRVVGFDNVKKQLGRWDAIVSKNRVTPHQSFPLHQANISMKPSSVFLSKFRIKSDLEKELEAAKPPQEIVNEETEEFPLTLEEIMEQRKEAAKLRAQQSYHEAKSRRQNKIKSKKFHRIQRREKMKQKLKDFELLQKNDPEAALQQLEELEKSRAGERASLKHRSTGKWAQNLQIRAKYDRESRAELAQQLAVSRELTQKVLPQESSESEDEVDIVINEDKENPWTKPQKTQDEIADFVSGYRKYWNEQNKKSEQEGESEIKSQVLSSNAESIQNESIENQDGVIIDGVEMFYIDGHDNKMVAKRATDTFEDIVNALSEPNFGYDVTPSKSMDDISLEDINSRLLDSNEDFVKTYISTSSWLVTEVKIPIDSQTTTPMIENMFDDIEYAIHTKLSNKLNRFKQKICSQNTNDPMCFDNEVSDEEYVPDLNFKSSKKRPDIDEALNETRKKQVANNDNIESLKALATTNTTGNSGKGLEESIDPNKFINMKPKHLLCGLPDMVTGDEAIDDNDEKENRQTMIAEAFEEDDIISDFQKEKQDAINKDKPEDIDLTLPGWGSWGGSNIKNNHKRKRFTLKFPKKLPRKDVNKGELIINENKSSKLKTHMVSELPFPFTSVNDFEASIHAPIGTTFIPVNASKKLTQPAISTKLGAIIEPMDQDMLVNRKKSKLRMK